MNKIYLTILTLLFCVGSVKAQSLKAYQKAAVKAEEKQNYSEALANYQVIINDAGKETVENYYRAAESARQLRVYPLAESYYLKVLNSEEQANYSLLQYWLGDTKKRLGKYSEAKSHFEQYIAAADANGGEKVELANKEIADCVWAIDRVQSPDPIQMKHLGEEVNSSSTEMAPYLKDDMLFFSSLRENPNDISCAFPLTRIYNAKTETESNAGKVDNIGMGGMEFNTNFNQENKHTAHTTFSSDGSRIYYTLCDDARVTNTTKCEIFYRTKQGSDQWGEAVALPEGINHPEYTATQPSVGYDETSGKEILFFASNRPGGKGGMDIWCSLMREDGKWGFPVAVEAINTEGDDITPFFHNEYQNLYFSSDGYQNLGGYDIYSIQKDGNNWGEARHMGYPLNTGYDDTYYSINSGRKKAHFVSNRPGGMCADTSEYCVCNDIYEVKMPVINIKVITINELTNEVTSEELFGVGVNLTQPGDDIFGSQAPEVDLFGNIYEEFTVDFGRNYNVTGTKEGYSTGSVDFSTPPPIGDTTIVVIIPLRPQVKLDVLTYDKLTEKELNGVTVEFFELPNDNATSSEREEFSHEYHYDIEFERKYMVVGTKAGYTSDTAYVTTENLKIEPSTLMEKLYLCKGLDPLPDVTLYFDNDQPEPDNMREVCAYGYEKAYRAYVGSYDNRTGYYAKQNVHSPAMKTFFDDDVKRGFANLETLANDLLDYFEGPGGSGNVEITIRGFASLRSNPRYNKALTKRRISSIRNYFANWVNKDTGKGLAPYNNRIAVTEAPRGDEDACKDCYVKSAITDVKACQDRRVEIIGITITQSPCDNKKIDPNSYSK